MFYAHEGAVRRRHLQDQTEQAWCLTIATNAISTWTAEYLGLAVQQFRDQGRHIDDEILAHISPAQSENIGLFGTITVDIDAELAQLGPTGHRPLRSRPLAPPDQAVPQPIRDRHRPDRHPRWPGRAGSMQATMV